MKSFRSIKFAPVLVVLLVIIGAGVWFLRWSDSFAGDVGCVILISIDTCRADRLSCYGFPLKTTPNIDAIAKEGVLFGNAVSPVPTTLPAHASMLTGTIPSYHGVHDNEYYKLGRSHVTLAEILAREGFTTGAVISAFVMDSQFGLDQGFESYNDEFEEELENTIIAQRRGAEVSRFAIDWLAEHKDEKFFLFLHYYDPHARYEPPEPFLSRYRNNLYAGEVAYADYCIGQVIKKLKEFGLYDSSLIIITSDHGEMLGEHRELTHGYFIYQSAIKVPLIVKLPGQASSRRIDNLVGLIDIVPTVCGVLGLEVPPHVQGEDMSRLLRGRKLPDQDRYLYCESMYPTRYKGNSLLGVITERWKYIQTTRPELYDLLSDPGEIFNLAEKLPQQARILQSRLKQILEQTVGKSKTEAKVELDEEGRKRLESLGYISGLAVSEDFGFLKDKDDPKDLLDFHLDYGKLPILFMEEKYDKAKVICERLLLQRPQLPRVHIRLGEIAVWQNDLDAAFDYFSKAVSINPLSPEAQRSLATVLTLQDRIDEAVKHYEKSLQIRPEQWAVLNNLARLYFRQQKLRQAYSCWMESLRLKADGPDVLNNLAWVKAVYENEPFYDPNKAVEMAQRACKLTEYKKHEFLDTLSVAYAAAGRFEEAIKTAERALEQARSEEQTELEAQIQEHLETFRAGRPYREAEQAERAESQ